MPSFSIFEHLKQVSRCKYIEYSSNTKNKFEIFSTNNKKNMVKTRIKQFCEAEGITVSSFEKSIGASNGYVNSISRSVGIDKLNRILEKYPYLNIEWLLTGNGDMRKQQEQHEVSNTIDIHQLINTIAEQAKEIGRLEQALEDAKRKKGSPAYDAHTEAIADAG